MGSAGVRDSILPHILHSSTSWDRLLSVCVCRCVCTQNCEEGDTECLKNERVPSPTSARNQVTIQRFVRHSTDIQIEIKRCNCKYSAGKRLHPKLAPFCNFARFAKLLCYGIFTGSHRFHSNRPLATVLTHLNLFLCINYLISLPHDPIEHCIHF